MASKTIRPIRIEGNIAYVPLTKGYEAIIDVVDVPLVEGFNWHVYINRKTLFYAARKLARIPGEKRKTVLLHRVIMDAAHNVEIDHKNGDGLLNCRSNLRAATRKQNARNQRKRTDNTSGEKGVSWHSRDKRWRAYIISNGKYIHLGNFLDRKSATTAYATASAKYHGEFGRTE